MLGKPLWSELQDPDRTEFERLHAPTSSEPRSLTLPILTLTKAFVDALDGKLIRSFLGNNSNATGSLQLLDELVEQLGGDTDSVSILRTIQRLRSRGGIAHLTGKERAAIEVELGIAELAPRRAFDSICLQIVSALESLDGLLRRSGE